MNAITPSFCHRTLLAPHATADATLGGSGVLEAWEQQVEEAASELGATLASSAQARGFIHFIGQHSRYLTRLLELYPDMYAAFLRGEATPCCEAITAEILSRLSEEIRPQAAQSYLRIQKQRFSLMVALADLSGQWSLEEVTGQLSDFASACVAYALEQVAREHVPKARLTPDAPITPHLGIAVLGMGKLGGRELNYSSDIDLIALYDPEALDFLSAPARNSFAVRLIKQMATFLQDRQEHGYVFRVDLRLRPDPASTGLAIALNTATSYYERVGQNWERAAMIKARHIAGDASVSARFLKEIQHFIWRGTLDFAAIDDILSIKRQMQAAEEPEITLPGHHLKTGYGGIREIEFLAQIHQLIWGGRMPELRIRPTCAVLEILAEKELIAHGTNRVLQHAYRLYRHIEHRLQMRADQQTHSLPESGAELERLAAFCSFEPELFAPMLQDTLEMVHSIFTEAFHDSPPLGHEGKLVFTGVEHDPETLATLSAMGFAQPEAVSGAIQLWHKGTKRCTRTKRAREILTELVPLILEELARTTDPDQAFRRFDAFLDALPVGVQPFSLFNANRNLLALIANITGNAPVLSRALSYYPQLLDPLVARTSQPLPDQPGAMRGALEQWIGMARDAEEQVENLCQFKLEQEFLIGVNLLTREITAQSASGYLSRLADNVIIKAVEFVTDQLEEKYGMRPPLHFAVIALGKLGTQELMIGSDLDVMFLYDIPEAMDEEDIIALTQYYNRLTARVINLLGQPTRTGALYAMDTKLRPYGSQGAVAVRLSGFSEYYSGASWLVENLALLQGRIVYASEAIEASARAALAAAKRIHAPRGQIADAIHDVRRKISEQFYTANPWDIKYVWGGMMDLQWVLKGLLARHSLDHALPEHSNRTVEHIFWLQEIGAVDTRQQQVLLETYTLYHTVLSYLRLCHGDRLEEDRIAEGLKDLLAQVTGMRDFDALRRQLLRAQGQIYHMYQNLAFM